MDGSKTKQKPSWGERKTSGLKKFINCRHRHNIQSKIVGVSKSTETIFCAAQDMHNCIISSHKNKEINVF